MASIDKLKSGLFRGRVRRFGYPDQTRSFQRRVDAEGWARKVEAELDRGAWKDTASPDSITLHGLLDDYLRDVVPGKRGKDVEMLRIATMQRDPLSRYKLSALSPVVLSAWRDARMAAGCAGATVNRELNLLSAVLGWGMKEKLIGLPANPVAGIRRPANAPPRDRRLRGDDRMRMAEALTAAARPSGGKKRQGNYNTGSRNAWLLPLVQLAVETGMRRGELCKIRWDFVDLRAGTIALPAAITKTATGRVIPLTPAARSVLEQLPRIDDEPRVFPVSQSAVTQAWRRARKRADVGDLRLHDLRHEAASTFFELGLNVMEVASITGHADLRSLKRYTHITPTHLVAKLAVLTAAASLHRDDDI